MKRFLLWSFDRGSIQYDVICVLILAFIFITPATAFKDRPPYMRVFADDPTVKRTEDNGSFVYTVKLDSSSFWNDAEHRKTALNSLEQYVKGPAVPIKMKPIYTTTGMTIAYAVWLEPVDGK